MKETFRCWAEIDRNALRHNAKVVRERIGSAEMLAVVKANAYGHGLMGVAETLAEQAQLFGVANLEEALALRERFHLPVIILGPSLPEEMATIVERIFIPTVSTFQQSDFRDRAGGDHSLRNFAAPGISEPSQTGDDVENADWFDSRDAEGQLNQLRSHIHHAKTDAGGDIDRRLCRWLPASSVKPRSRRLGSRPTLSAAWTRDDGSDDDRCFAYRRGRCWRGSGLDGAARQRSCLLR